MAQAFEERATAFGLDPSFLGRVITHEGKEFVVVGLNTRAPKMPVVLQQREGGHSMKASAGWICAKFNHPYTPPPHLDRAYVAAEGLKKRGDSFGISSDLIGRVFTLGGRRVRFLGLKPRVRKQPVALQALDDLTYRKCSVNAFRGILHTMETQE